MMRIGICDDEIKFAEEQEKIDRGCIVNLIHIAKVEEAEFRRAEKR